MFGSQVPAGALVAAVARSGSRRMVVPLFVTSVDGARYSIGGEDASILPGTPIYNLAGELVAIAGGPGRPRFAISARDAAERLAARAREGSGHPASLGLTFQRIDNRIARVFGETGALVADVVEDGPAATAGVEPGDVVVGVGGRVVESVEAVQRSIVSLSPGMPQTLRIRRTAVDRMLTVTPATAYEIAAAVHARTRNPPAGAPEASALFAASALGAAVVSPVSRVLRVNGRRIASEAEARRELRRGRSPALLYLQHEGRRFFAVVERPS